MSFINKLNEITGGKFYMLRPVRADYNEALRSVCMYFRVSAEFADFLRQNEADLNNTLSEMLLLSATSSFMYLTLDQEYISDIINPLIKTFQNICRVRADDIRIIKAKGAKRVDITVDSMLYPLLNANCARLSEMLSDEFCEEVSVFVAAQGGIDEEAVLAELKDQPVTVTEKIQKFVRYLDIPSADLVKCIGPKVKGPIRDISDITEPEEEVNVFAVITNKRKLIKKGTEGTEKGRRYFSFKLTGSSGSGMDGLFFPTVKNETAFDVIEDGSRAVLSGSISRSAASLKMIVRRVTACTLNKQVSPASSKKAGQEQYITLFPVPYTETRQMSIISEKTEFRPITGGRVLVGLDVETTGISFASDRITEIALVKYIDGRFTESMQSLIDPEIEISQRITELTGITNEMVKNKPKFYEVAGDIKRFIGDGIIVGYNVGFDIGMLNSYYKETGYKFENEYIDVMQDVYRSKFRGGGNNKLVNVAKKLNIEYEGAHRAFNDVIATFKVYFKLREAETQKKSAI